MSLTISEEGYKSMERELENLQKKLMDIRIYKNTIAVENGNVWHDNSDFEQSEIEERRLLREIADIKDKMSNSVIFKSNSSNLNLVDYGAKVEIFLKDDEEEETMTILFSDSDEVSEYSKISANSPLGKTIFQKEVGFVGSYIVDDIECTVKVLKIEY